MSKHKKPVLTSMRILTGVFRGRKLTFPWAIRPTQSRVRKAIFDIIGDIEGLHFLELYAGSGAVGFEALSRGAVKVTFVEIDRTSVSSIKFNQEELALTEVSEVIAQDSIRAIELFKAQSKVFDIVFFDPPYHQDLAKKTLHTLGVYDIVAPNGLIIVQHFTHETLPDTLGVFSLFRRYDYGNTSLSVFTKSQNA